MESDNEVDDQVSLPIQNGVIEETPLSQSRVCEAEDSESLTHNSSSQNVALREELSNPPLSPDNTLSFGEDKELFDASENLVRPEGVDIKLNDKSLDNTLSEDNEDTFDTEKDFAVPSEEDTSLSVSLCSRVAHTRHPSELSESEILKYPGQPHAVIGGKIYPFDMGNEDFFPDFELPHDNHDSQTDVIINDVIQAIPKDNTELKGLTNDDDTDESEFLPHPKLKLSDEEDLFARSPDCESSDRIAHPDLEIITDNLHFESPSNGGSLSDSGHCAEGTHHPELSSEDDNGQLIYSAISKGNTGVFKDDENNVESTSIPNANMKLADHDDLRQSSVDSASSPSRANPETSPGYQSSQYDTSFVDSAHHNELEGLYQPELSSERSFQDESTVQGNFPSVSPEMLQSSLEPLKEILTADAAQLNSRPTGYCTKSASALAAKCLIAAENSLNFEKQLKSPIS